MSIAALAYRPPLALLSSSVRARSPFVFLAGCIRRHPNPFQILLLISHDTVSIVLFFLTLACRIAKIRENGRAERAKREAAAPVMTAATGTPNANNYASQGPGGYNGYTLPPRPVQAQYPPSRKPDQSEWKPQPAQGYPAAPYPLPGDTNGPTAEKDGEVRSCLVFAPEFLTYSSAASWN